MLQIVLNDYIYNFDDLIENFAIKRGRCFLTYLFNILKKIIIVMWTKYKFAHQHAQILNYFALHKNPANLVLFFLHLIENDNSNS